MFQRLLYLGKTPIVEDMPVFIAAAKGDFWLQAESGLQEGSS